MFRSPIAAAFRNRVAELGRLEEWWASPERMPLAVYGRRRVGKSWLLRRFADGKPAVVLVAERLTAGAQLDRFAATLEPLLGVRPQLDDVPSLFRAFYRAGQREQLLVVVDEFPWLLPASEEEATRTLSALAAVLEEERDRSQLKLVLCGSLVAQMEALFAERHPLHGRLVRFEVRPFDFTDARQLLADHDPVEQFQRFAIAGGMPRYLAALSAGNLRQAVCRQVLDRDGPLWDEARAILGQELRQPAVYFAILEQLAGGDKELGELTNATRLPGATLSRYLATLAELRIVSRRLPLGAPATARVGHWRLGDAFLRFWFRFVFPYQPELEAGLRAGDLYDTEVAPVLGHVVAPTFEEWCRAEARRLGVATQVGAWWGPARHASRRAGTRTSEEIDIVGTVRGRVTVVGEAKWTARPMDAGVLHALDEHKLPALAKAGFTLGARPHVRLYSRSGYTDGLVAAAATRGEVSLVDVPASLAAEG